MRRTRDGLTEKLDLLKRRLLHPQLVPRTGAKKAMATKKATKSSASNGASKASESKETSTKKSNAKRSPSASAKGSTSGKKATPKRVAGAIANKTTEVLTEVLTGAAVGAVTGAAERVAAEPTAVAEEGSVKVKLTANTKAEGTNAATKKRTTAKKSGEVLGEMLSGAAVCAVAGAAKSILPTEEKKSKGRTKSK